MMIKRGQKATIRDVGAVTTILMQHFLCEALPSPNVWFILPLLLDFTILEALVKFSIVNKVSFVPIIYSAQQKHFPIFFRLHHLLKTLA
jgi:hypothetical protein